MKLRDWRNIKIYCLWRCETIQWTFQPKRNVETIMRSKANTHKIAWRHKTLIHFLFSIVYVLFYWKGRGGAISPYNENGLGGLLEKASSIIRATVKEGAAFNEGGYSKTFEEGPIRGRAHTILGWYKSHAQSRKIGSCGRVQLVERRASNRKVTEPWFDSPWCGIARRRVLKKDT